MPDLHPLGKNKFQPDTRDWPAHRLELAIASGVSVPLTWQVSRILDQGINGTCVAAGTLGACDCDDEFHVDSKFTSASILPFWKLIPNTGALPGGGAQVRDGLKAAKAAGYIDGYAQLRTLPEILSWIEKHGPVLLGTDWMSDMDDPTVAGVVNVGGSVRGGHCYYGNGDGSVGFELVNSWGIDWGKAGHFYMSRASLAKLRQGDFEAWALTQKAPAPPTPTPTPNPDAKGCLAAALGLLVGLHYNSTKLKAAIALLHQLEGMM